LVPVAVMKIAVTVQRLARHESPERRAIPAKTGSIAALAATRAMKRQAQYPTAVPWRS
jgi:hypothetical protein